MLSPDGIEGVLRIGSGIGRGHVLRVRGLQGEAGDLVGVAGQVFPALQKLLVFPGLFRGALDVRAREINEHLTRPDLGRKLSDEAVATIKEKCQMNPQAQIYVSDGLSSSAIKANAKDCLEAILQGLKSKGITAGTPFFVKYGRVGVMDQVSEIVGSDVTCVLIGERPGLITANSMSAYMGYKCTVGMNESRRTLISNIHSAGTNPAEGGAHVAEILKIMLDKKVSGVDLKL